MNRDPSPPSDFTSWLRTQQGRKDPVGDFAQDFLQDTCRPRKSITLETLENYLTDKPHVHDAAIDALRDAWAEFQIASGGSSS